MWAGAADSASTSTSRSIGTRSPSSSRTPTGWVRRKSSSICSTSLDSERMFATLSSLPRRFPQPPWPCGRKRVRPSSRRRRHAKEGRQAQALRDDAWVRRSASKWEDDLTAVRLSRALATISQQRFGASRLFSGAAACAPRLSCSTSEHPCVNGRGSASHQRFDCPDRRVAVAMDVLGHEGRDDTSPSLGL
jgi:hypothetical protein